MKHIRTPELVILSIKKEIKFYKLSFHFNFECYIELNIFLIIESSLTLLLKNIDGSGQCS